MAKIRRKKEHAIQGCDILSHAKRAPREEISFPDSHLSGMLDDLLKKGSFNF